MNLFFSDRPGAHERHLRRKVNNPLFGAPDVSQQDVLQARAADEAEHKTFMDSFYALARDAGALDASVDAELLIDLKNRLEQCYEQSCSIMGNMADIQQGLHRLIDSIMQSLLHASSSDEHAHQKLLEEQAARKIHFELLQHSLIADLLRPASPITSDDLVPTLLSAGEPALRAALGLFTAEQRLLLCEHGNRMLQDVSSDHPKIVHSRKMLAILCEHSQQTDEPAAGASHGLAS